MKSFIFHLKNYLNLNLRMSRQPFILISLLHAFIIVPYLLGVFPQGDVEAILTSARLDFSSRIIIFGHSLILIPACIKRLKDLDASKIQIDLALLVMYIPNLLLTLLSDNGFNVLEKTLGYISIAGMIVTIMLLAIKGSKGKNSYGKPL